MRHRSWLGEHSLSIVIGSIQDFRFGLAGRRHCTPAFLLSHRSSPVSHQACPRWSPKRSVCPSPQTATPETASLPSDFSDTTSSFISRGSISLLPQLRLSRGCRQALDAPQDCPEDPTGQVPFSQQQPSIRAKDSQELPGGSSVGRTPQACLPGRKHRDAHDAKGRPLQGRRPAG